MILGSILLCIIFYKRNKMRLNLFFSFKREDAKGTYYIEQSSCFVFFQFKGKTVVVAKIIWCRTSRNITLLFLP